VLCPGDTSLDSALKAVAKAHAVQKAKEVCLSAYNSCCCFCSPTFFLPPALPLSPTSVCLHRCFKQEHVTEAVPEAPAPKAAPPATPAPQSEEQIQAAKVAQARQAHAKVSNIHTECLNILARLFLNLSFSHVIYLVSICSLFLDQVTLIEVAAELRSIEDNCGKFRTFSNFSYKIFKNIVCFCVCVCLVFNHSINIHMCRFVGLHAAVS
jgi:hypothetical protein